MHRGMTDSDLIVGPVYDKKKTHVLEYKDLGLYLWAVLDLYPGKVESPGPVRY